MLSTHKSRIRRVTVYGEEVRSFDVAAVCFDMDGVLVDSSEQVTLAIRKWAEETGVDVSGRHHEYQSLTESEFVGRIAPSLDSVAEANRIREIERDLATLTRAVPGARDVYGRIPRDQSAIVTNGSRGVATIRLWSAGIPLPPVFVTSDDVSRGKPDPEPYVVAMSRLGTAPERTLAIEDSVRGAVSAREAGMAVIGFDRGDGDPELRGVADVMIPSMRSVLIS
ncbi:HAD family hydrolase [Nocardiopsis alba]|uniref:HAD family hydrolase n=1 Tax=Nocardiopsis alba TaxID=53437 RepID=UPI00366AA479